MLSLISRFFFLDKGKSVCTSTSGQNSQKLRDDLSWVSRLLDDVDFVSDTGGSSSQSNKFTAQEENNEFNIAQPRNGTYTLQDCPSVEPEWDAIMHRERELLLEKKVTQPFFCSAKMI